MAQGIPIKNVFNAVFFKLQTAATTRLATIPVFKGDPEGWAGAKGLFVMYSGGSETEAAISNSWWGDHNILVELRQEQTDATGTVADGDWYDQFLEACEELNVFMSTVSWRTMTDAQGENFSNVTKTWEIGYGEPQGKTRMLVAQFTLTCTVELPSS